MRGLEYLGTKEFFLLAGKDPKGHISVKREGDVQVT